MNSRVRYVLFLIWSDNGTQELRVAALESIAETLQSPESCREFFRPLLRDKILVERAIVAYLRDFGDEHIVNRELLNVAMIASHMRPVRDAETRNNPSDAYLLATCLMAARRQLCCGYSPSHAHDMIIMVAILALIK